MRNDQCRELAYPSVMADESGKVPTWFSRLRVFLTHSGMKKREVPATKSTTLERGIREGWIAPPTHPGGPWPDRPLGGFGMSGPEVIELVRSDERF